MADDAREYFGHLLRSLVEHELGWIADEIEAEIGAGDVVHRQDRAGGRRTAGLWKEPFDADKCLAIAMRIVVERAQVAHAAWRETEELVRGRLGGSSVAYVDLDRDGAAEFGPFTVEFENALDDLVQILQKAATECAMIGPDVERLSRRPEKLRWGR